MSGLLAGKVWLSGLDPDLKPLAATLADIGDDDGSSIWPSVAYVAWRLGRSESSVQRGLRKLREDGVLEIVSGFEGGRGVTTEYRMLESKLPTRRSWSEERVAFEQKGSVCEVKGSRLEGERVAPTLPDPSLSVKELKENTKPENLENQNQEKHSGKECPSCGEFGVHTCSGPSAAKAKRDLKRQRADERAIRKAGNQRTALEQSRPRFVDRSPPWKARGSPAAVEDDSLDPDYPRL